MKKYIVLIILGVVTLIGFAIRYGLGEHSFLWQLWGVIDVSFSVALGLLAYEGYSKYLRLEDTIIIRFKLPDEKLINTGLSSLRKDFNRQEVLGLLGMIQKDAKNRFDIDFTKTGTFLQRIQDIQKGKEKTFDIDISEEELKQFECEQKKIRHKSN